MATNDDTHKELAMVLQDAHTQRDMLRQRIQDQKDAAIQQAQTAKKSARALLRHKYGLQLEEMLGDTEAVVGKLAQRVAVDDMRPMRVGYLRICRCWCCALGAPGAAKAMNKAVVPVDIQRHAKVTIKHCWCGWFGWQTDHCMCGENKDDQRQDFDAASCSVYDFLGCLFGVCTVFMMMCIEVECSGVFVEPL